MARNRDEAAPERSFLAVARRAARRCGVTRLADVTGLDRIGLPVWQAIRPASRALSVHQGKAMTATGARIGALCEAIESHCAEQAEPDGPRCSYAELSTSERLDHPDDLLADRSRHHDWHAPLHWCRASDLLSGRTLYLPHSFVSLDLRPGMSSRIERSSNGLGAGPDEAHALSTALFELIERDALARWNSSGLAARVASRMEPDTIPFDWFRHWRTCLAALGAELDVFAMRTITGASAFRCAIGGDAAFAAGRRLAIGCAAHADAETALAKSFAEAAQTRLTLIAGVRDDLLFRHYDGAADAGRPGGWPVGRSWEASAVPVDILGATIDRLVDAGYRQIVVKRLDPDLDGVIVLKAFVPGLALEHRSRRVPA